MHTNRIITPGIPNEGMMKALLLEHWRAKGFINSSTIIINEFTCGGLVRRVDLAILKEDLFIGV
jgi:hypothetical protein